LIWLIVVAVVLVGGGAFLAARDWKLRGAIAAIGLAGVAGYWFVGKPDMGDDQLGERIARIEKHWTEKGPDGLEPTDIILYIQTQARKEPANPRWPFALGTIWEMAEQPQQALLAYDDALRRDPNDLEIIKKVANLRFRMSGTIDGPTSALYHEWFRREPHELHIGYFAGMGDWLAGRKEEAEKIWADVESRTPKDDPRRQMYAALRQQFGVDKAPQATPEGQKPPG
jgi:cytochrome c-type biogenesis protein CcmH/NrfG